VDKIREAVVNYHIQCIAINSNRPLHLRGKNLKELQKKYEIQLDKAESSIRDAICEENKKYKDALEDMVRQFANTGSHGGIACYNTGGLSALEYAFEVLGWSEPYPCPEHQCQYPKCGEYATCGIPTNIGYKRACGKHYTEYSKKKYQALIKKEVN